MTKRGRRFGLNVTLGCDQCFGGTLGREQGLDQDESRALVVILHSERERSCGGRKVGLAIAE